MQKSVPFDLTDSKNIGRPFYFDMDKYLDQVEDMIRTDELKFALVMLENVPGWYRDYPTERQIKIKNTLLGQCYDDFDYANDFDEANWTYKDIVEQCLSDYTFPRANVVAEELEALNKENKKPWIFEISPSHGWLPLGFEHKGFKFDFCGKNLNQKAMEKIKLHLKCWRHHPEESQQKWLVCFESIEHMWDEYSFERSAKKLGHTFDKIFLSVPMYTLGGGLPDWSTRRVGHVRTWTPTEFWNFANKIFPGYKWIITTAHSMVLKGIKT